MNTDAAGVELGLPDEAEQAWCRACTVMSVAQAVDIELVLDEDGQPDPAWVAQAEHAFSELDS